MDPTAPMETRKVIHVDMDAFYASVEQRDDRSLAGKPVVVGGDPSGRGVVAAASYEARAFGIRSAMPMKMALARCPHAVRVPGDFGKYREVSKTLHEIFSRYTDLIEPVALDEAYLDVTNNKLGVPLGHRVAKMLKSEIRRRLRLTASAGLAPNKFLAKVASDLRKPDGLVVVMPEQAACFLRDLPVGRIPGVGKVTETKFREMGIETIGELAQAGLEQLTDHFGKRGLYLHHRSLGLDDTPVSPRREPKQLSSETTFPDDVFNTEEMRATLVRLSETVSARLQRRGLQGRIVTVKIRYPDFETVTRSRTHGAGLRNGQVVGDLAVQLLQRSQAFQRGVRLLGVGVSGFTATKPSSSQMDLFGTPEGDHAELRDSPDR